MKITGSLEARDADGVQGYDGRRGLRVGRLGAIPRREAGVIVVAVVIFLAFAFATKGTFATISTWSGLLNTAAELGVIVVGVTILMIAGEFDLSVGANYAFAGMLTAILLSDGWSPIVAAMSGLALGAAIGIGNGLATIYLQIPSFITTLGTYLFISGITLLVTGGMPVTYFGHSSLLNVLAGVGPYGLRWEVLWWIGIAIVFSVLLHRTPFGNWVYATGGKRNAANAVGVDVVRVRLLAFLISGVLAAFSGELSFAHLASMSPSNGQDLELQAIAAAVIGGVSLYGGQGSMLGAFVGNIILNMLAIGLVQAGASALWYETFVGLIVIAAVAMHVKLIGLKRSR